MDVRGFRDNGNDEVELIREPLETSEINHPPDNDPSESAENNVVVHTFEPSDDSSVDKTDGAEKLFQYRSHYEIHCIYSTNDTPPAPKLRSLYECQPFCIYFLTDLANHQDFQHLPSHTAQYLRSINLHPNPSQFPLLGWRVTVYTLLDVSVPILDLPGAYDVHHIRSTGKNRFWHQPPRCNVVWHKRTNTYGAFCGRTPAYKECLFRLQFPAEEPGQSVPQLNLVYVHDFSPVFIQPGRVTGFLKMLFDPARPKEIVPITSLDGMCCLVAIPYNHFSIMSIRGLMKKLPTLSCGLSMDCDYPTRISNIE